MANTCEYDSKLMVLEHQGRILLWARTNAIPITGGRYVQFTSSRNGVSDWAPFQLIKFRDSFFRRGGQGSSDISDL